MRRALALVSLLLVLLGLELSTEALTLVVERLGAGFSSLFTGVDADVPAVRFVVGVVGLAVGLTLWVLLFWSARKRDAVASVGGGCPQCGNETKRVRRREWHRLLSVLLEERLTRRKCDTCGWVGLSVKQ